VLAAILAAVAGVIWSGERLFRSWTAGQVTPLSVRDIKIFIPNDAGRLSSGGLVPAKVR
jgi:hypothetical protein